MRREPVAFVSGAARGLGLAIATRLGRAGYAVVVSDIDETAAQEASRHLSDGGIVATASVCDVSSGSSVEAAIERVANCYGRLDLLVNNAGIVGPQPFEQASEEELLHLVDVHLGGAFRCCHAAFDLLQQSEGSIVSLASILARVGMPMRVSYCAAKSGIEGMTRALAVEWASSGIRVNAVAPGFVPTDQVRSVPSDRLLSFDQLSSLVPLRRLGKPEDIAATVAFLASSEASYITGQVITVDGGLTVSGEHWVALPGPAQRTDYED